MDTQKQQIVDNLKQANNILVTVSSNPSVDQLAACIGLTLALNKMKKHATAVFSGTVPSIIEFLEPEKTLEKTTDSLRDFIIAIDKAKADKLRYKVEDKFVKIFITPYRTSINQKDLEFSEGDFNVDVVLALGVHRQADLDQAITAHGRILHDATVASINNQPNIELGSINLLEPQASSLSEIAVELLDLLDKSMVDNQIATALLTGIVAETDRFRNAKTTPTTMSISAELLTAGANQQLVASKLDTPPPAPMPPARVDVPSVPPQVAPPVSKADDGTLEINHDHDEQRSQPVSLPPTTSPVAAPVAAPKPPQIHIDENGHVSPIEDDKVSDNNLPPLPSPSSLPPLPPLPPITPPPSFPPQQHVEPSPSPLNPFAPANNNQPPLPPLPDLFRPSPPVPDLGLPPLPSDTGQGDVSAAPMPYTDTVVPPLPPLPSPSSLPPLPPLPPITPPPSFPPQQHVEPSPAIQPGPDMTQPQQPPKEPPLPTLPPVQLMPPTIHTDGPHLMMQPPTFGSQLTAGTVPQNEDEDEDDPSGSAISLPQVEKPTPLLDREPLPSPSSLPPLPPTAPSISLPPPPPPKVEPSPDTPVTGGDQIEPPLSAEELASPEPVSESSHLDYIESPVPILPPPPPPVAKPISIPDQPSTVTTPTAVPPSTEPVADKPQTFTAQEQAVDVESARNAIDAAFQDDNSTEESLLEPITALNAQPLGRPLHELDNPDAPPPGFSNDPNADSTLPPPVPPPLIPPMPS
jgi:hypothetical protein